MDRGSNLGSGQLDEGILDAHQREINVIDFVEANIKQVSELLQAVDNANLVAREVTKGPRTVLQRLPRHMRRRAMSYNVKRLPRRQRQYALPFIQMSKHRTKPPSRFWRRRPRNLLQAYARRKRKNIWLETHIWHAKRFHMIEKWGYKIPFRSFQRAFRPSYRDSVHHCVIQDISFLRCFQITMKDRTAVLSALRPLFAPLTCLTPASNFAADGKFEVTTLLYKPDEYPRGFIGPVRFMWSINRDGWQRLTIWTHPSTSEQVLKYFITLLDASASNEDEKSFKEANNGEGSNDCLARPDGEYVSNSLSCTIMDYREQFTRFRLYGPKSLAILENVLHVVQDFSRCEEWTQSFRAPNAFWKDDVRFRSFDELPNGFALNLLVFDPRLNMTFKKQKPKAQRHRTQPFNFKIAPPLSSIFWDTGIHKSILEARVSEEELQRRRRENMPLTKLSSSKIPLLLIVRNTGVGTTKAFNGVDIVIPAGFARDFWLAMQYGTARAIGYKDQKWIEFESDLMNFPSDTPDCDAGTKILKEEHAQLKVKYYSRPHNRRVQYKTTLHIKHPFTFAWKYLIRQRLKEDNDNGRPSKSHYVLRDRSCLKAIDNWLRGKAAEPGNVRPKGRPLISLRQTIKDSFTIVVDILRAHSLSLIPVQVEAKHRGRPLRYGYIYAAVKADLEAFAKQGKSGIVEEPKCCVTDEVPAENVESEKPTTEIKGYIEVSDHPGEKFVSLNQLFPDKEILRKRKKVLSKRRKREKAREAKRRKREVQAGLVASANQCPEKASTSDEEADASGPKSDNFCSRKAIGRIVRGDYSFSSAKGKGIGYCIAGGLKYIKDGKALFRNVTSKYYHLARITVNKQQIYI